MLLSLVACAGTSTGVTVPSPSENAPWENTAPSREVVSADTLREIVLPDVAKENVRDTAAGIVSESDSSTVEGECSASGNAYVEISRIARKALARADSFYALQMTDSVSAIVEQFSVLNPLWEEWMEHVKSLDGKIRGAAAVDRDVLERLLVALANANARRADYSEIGAIVDSILALSPGDSLKSIADSVAGKAYFRTFGKVASIRDSALSMARERAEFDAAERKLTEALMRYPDFADTLRLREALQRISSFRTETAASAEYWKSHDPKRSLEEGKTLAEKGKWKEAKAVLEKLRSSALRGEAIRELDSLNVRFCTEKRERAASLFGKAKRRKGDKTKLLTDAVELLDSCLEFAPEYKDRETVISNRKFLLREIGE